MNLKLIVVLGLLLLVLFGCTQSNPDSNQNTVTSITDNDFNITGSNSDDNLSIISNTNSSGNNLKLNDMNMPNLPSCKRMDYAWNCNLEIGVTPDADNFFEKMNELTDWLGTFCFTEEGNGSISSTIDANLDYYCLLYLDDSSKPCVNSLECKGSCIPSIDSNYDLDFISNEVGAKESCPGCKGVCTSSIASVGTSGTKWVELNDGYLEVKGIQ
jgi:hypothetical protein